MCIYIYIYIVSSRGFKAPFTTDFMSFSERIHTHTPTVAGELHGPHDQQDLSDRIQKLHESGWDAGLSLEMGPFEIDHGSLIIKNGSLIVDNGDN